MIPSGGLEEVGMLGLHRLHAILVQLRTRLCPCSVKTEDSFSRLVVQIDMLGESFPPPLAPMSRVSSRHAFGPWGLLERWTGGLDEGAGRRTEYR